MQNAIFHYDYNPIDRYRPSDVNLGDYIQSLAAAQYFDHVDTTIDRDQLNTQSDQLRIIGNGWYNWHPHHHQWADSCDFLPVSIHINNRPVSQDALAHLKRVSQKEPIGCRDLPTHHLLQKAGIESYFSSCLTTTLRRENFVQDQAIEREGIIFADCPLLIRHDKWLSQSLRHLRLYRYLKGQRNLNIINRILHEALSHYPNEPIHFTQHSCSFAESHSKRFELARKLLQQYARAQLVITSRIHCALPCLALGTPVIYVATSFDKLRLNGLHQYINHIILTNQGNLYSQIDFKDHMVTNSDRFLERAVPLRERCQAFIGQA